MRPRTRSAYDKAEKLVADMTEVRKGEDNHCTPFDRSLNDKKLANRTEIQKLSFWDNLEWSLEVTVCTPRTVYNPCPGHRRRLIIVVQVPAWVVASLVALLARCVVEQNCR